ncbi:SDR family oxidoreductase [Nocardioides sp. CFH 31398]|uniref:SDR family oxidoreductase n=1 Tax=Nocardioides sp. CFH 31398 TaxID=2919579 RepID=UPI001F054F53|nr:SDR family oxidoreductase [Nocardioides sp. CFH 31398]MCH1867994.1 SDR family oxidoreductase [Nocardioides sp. CFH 31398]
MTQHQEQTQDFSGRTALISGANKGIGLEIARGLGRLGLTVGVGSRDAERGARAVAELEAEGLDVFAVPLDVSDDDSVRAAAALLAERGGLDVLVNNAGITGTMPQEPTVVDLDTIRTVLETNVLGVIRLTNAVLPLLRESASPRIVNVSSGVGSLARQSAAAVDGQAGPVAAAYSPSKTFLNAVMLQYVRELAGTPILINAACPGYVATDLNGFQGHRTVEQGAATPIRLATLPDDGPTGGFFEDAGVVPW